MSRAVAETDLSSRPLKNQGQVQVLPGPATRPPPTPSVRSNPPAQKLTPSEARSVPRVSRAEKARRRESDGAVQNQRMVRSLARSRGNR
jgi:hypothetical protein